MKETLVLKPIKVCSQCGTTMTILYNGLPQWYYSKITKKYLCCKCHGWKYRKLKKEQTVNLCKCGCGAKVKSARGFLPYHNAYTVLPFKQARLVVKSQKIRSSNRYRVIHTGKVTKRITCPSR